MRHQLFALSVLPWLVACGQEGAALLPQSAKQSALSNGAAADAIIGQASERGRGTTRTDGGGFGALGSVAVASGATTLWVADTGNRRVLGWRDTGAISASAMGASADIVLLQEDLFTTDHRNIPTREQIAPVGVAVDAEQRVYVHDGTHVLVFEDPAAASNDRTADYDLLGLPDDIVSVRALPGKKIAVVGASSVVFYDQGMREPYAQSTVSPGCGDYITDVARIGSILFVSCTSGSSDVTCDDGVTTGCSAVFVYSVDANTGLPAREPIANGPPVPYKAYNDFAGITSMVGNDAGQLLIVDALSHRVFRWEGTEAHANATIANSAATPNRTPATTSPTPYVFGQESVSTSPIPNYHPTNPGIVSEQGLDTPTYIDFDNDDKFFWLVDSGNHRVLRFNSSAKLATTVIGQPDMMHAYANRLEPGSFAAPTGVAVNDDGSRGAVVDGNAHRVLLFDNLASLVTGGDPSFIVGQSSAVDYWELGVMPPVLGPGSLSSPRAAAYSPTGALFVTDNGNTRILAFEGTIAANRPVATRIYGALANGTSAGLYGNLDAIVVSTNRLYVASGNRILVWDVATPRVKPTRVFGQPMSVSDNPVVDDIDNSPNRGMGIARADTLSRVVGLALDSDGTLWVADAGNNRVLWFEQPEASDLISATTADGVVGQPDFTATDKWADAVSATRYGFANIGGIAVDNAGTLWVSDVDDSRILVFHNPKEKDPTVQLAGADLVLGQVNYNATDANNSLNGINAGTVSAPRGLSVSRNGQTLLVADAGNTRVLRYVDTAAPVFTFADGATLEVAPGGTASISFAVDTGTAALAVPTPDGVTLVGDSVSYTAPVDALVGTTVHANLIATVTGARTVTTTATVNFVITRREMVPEVGRPRKPRTVLAASDGCQATHGGEWGALLVVGVGLLLRRKR